MQTLGCPPHSIPSKATQKSWEQGCQAEQPTGAWQPAEGGGGAGTH